MSANFSSIYPEFKLNVVNDEKKTSYAFENYRLEAFQMMLYRGEKEVSLPPKAVETLLVLVKHQGAIVSKEELIKQVWKDTVVEESNLLHYLSVLRRTLGETQDGKPYIETFRRRGYRFNGEAQLFETAPSENGSAPVEKISVAPRHDVERSGNVLKVVDWQEAETPPAIATTSGEESAKVSPPRKFPVGKAAIIAAVVLVLIGSLFYLRSKVSPPPNLSLTPEAS